MWYLLFSQLILLKLELLHSEADKINYTSDVEEEKTAQMHKRHFAVEAWDFERWQNMDGIGQFVSTFLCSIFQIDYRYQGCDLFKQVQVDIQMNRPRDAIKAHKCMSLNRHGDGPMLQSTIPHICHRHHRRCLCKKKLPGVNFYRFNAKNWQFTVYFAIITQKMGNLLCILS